MLLQITGQSFCAGIKFDEYGFPLDWAPYLKFMSNWSSTKILNYCKCKRYKVEIIDP